MERESLLKEIFREKERFYKRLYSWFVRNLYLDKIYYQIIMMMMERGNSAIIEIKKFLDLSIMKVIVMKKIIKNA